MLIFLAGCSESGLFVANTLARFDDYTLTSGIPYGPDPLNQLDVYQPEATSKAVIIFFYGGCWGACTTYTRQSYRFAAQALTDEGYVVVIPDYRLYPDVLFPQIMDDAVRVVEWVSKNIVEYGASPDRIILMGHSAGAHIAAMLAVNEAYLGDALHKRIVGFIGLAGPYDFVFDQPYQYKLFAGIDYRETQPSSFVDGSEPPMLLLHGDADTKVYLRNINNMTVAIEANHGRVEPHIYQGVDHVNILASLSIPLRGRYEVMDDILLFLNSIDYSILGNSD